MANNVITAVFSSSNITYTKPAYQYDYGMILKFSGIELPQAYEVHFSNTEFCGESISQIGDESGVTIPDEMFLSGSPIYAWTFLHTGEDDGETVYKTVISINKRAQPSDIEPTPVQQDVITQAIAALNVAVEQTAADVVAAGESATAASNSAEASGQAKNDAVQAKNDAVNAKNDAETAKGKAEDAQEAAERAAGSVLGLTADASVDSNVGTPSVSVSVATESDHKNMSFAFHNLKGVQGDPGDTGVGISSVVLNADYTLTITLTNGNSYTTSSIRGEVGATPDLTIGTVSTLPEGSQATATITGTDENPVLNLGIPIGDTGDPGISPTITVTEISGGHSVEVVDAQGTQTFDVMDGEVSEEELETALIDKADVITSTASGEIVTIADGGKDMPVVDLKLSLLPVQSGSGDPSPDNVRPISGWTGVDVTRCRKNLYDKSNIVNGYTNASLEFVSDSSARATGLIAINGECVFSCQRTNTSSSVDSQLRLVTFDANKQIISRTLSTKVGANAISHVAVSDPNAKYVRAELFTGSNIVDTAILEWGSSYTDYESYNGNTYPISWQSSAGTVYGGSLDVTTGLLTVPTGCVDFSDLTWETRYTGSVNKTMSTSLNPTVTPYYPSFADRANYKLEKYKYREYVIAVTNLNNPDAKNVGLYLYHTSSSTDAVVTIYLVIPIDDTPSGKFVYKTTTSIAPVATYQLDPVQISTLLGTNNFWSNGNGQIDLEYRADTKLYIEQLTKPSEDDMVANANIQSGKFFMVGNRLFLSTTAIAQGEQIVVGTNCSEVSLADALNQINA